MIKKSTMTTTLIGASLAVFGQPIQAGTWRRMADVVRAHCFKNGFKKFAADLKGAFHRGRAESYLQRAKEHYAKADEPISRDTLSDTSFKGVAAGFGLVATGIAAYNIPKETVNKYAGKAVDYGAATGLGSWYLALLLQWPKCVVQGSLAIPTVLWGLYALRKAKNTQLEPSELQQAQDWERVLERTA